MLNQPQIFVVKSVHSISVLKMASNGKSEKQGVQILYSHLEFEFFGYRFAFYVSVTEAVSFWYKPASKECLFIYNQALEFAKDAWDCMMDTNKTDFYK